LRVEEDAIIGREREHRRLVVADENRVQQTVLWWGGGDQPLPEGRFDLAYALRARNYRGEQQLQVEWIDARPLGSEATESARPALTIVDWRQDPNPRSGLETLSKEELIVWAEADAPGLSQDIRVENRLGLSPSSTLIIWTAPPGSVELVRAVEAVTPSTVCLVACEPATEKLRVFLERLMGMVKHDVRMRDGHVNVRRLAAAIGHREPTVRAGLQWLEVRGKLRIIKTSEESMTLQIEGEPSHDLHGVESRLRHLLNETAAYRRHFRAAPVEALGIAS
jgi:single-stranded-DNA-specific exonuclease